MQNLDTPSKNKNRAAAIIKNARKRVENAPI